MNNEQRGLVVAAHGRRGRLETPAGDVLPFIVRGRRLRVVCGDRVAWHAGVRGDAVILTAVEERHNALSRVDPATGRTEVLAANIERLCVVVAPVPEPDWFIVDRFLVAAASMGAGKLLVSNKADLPESANPDYRAELAAYAAAGYRRLSVSARQRQSLDRLLAALDAEQAMLAGQSGVGKSSLINALVPEAGLATTGLTRKGEGRHTTTASIMHRLANGARLIDSPGVRDFLPAIGRETSIQAGFPEILARSNACRFSDCRHLREPGCAVREAAAAGTLWPRRYESYRRLIHQQLASGRD